MTTALSSQGLADQRPAAGVPVAGFPAPYWRELLGDRWQAELVQLTELSLAYHQIAEGADARARPATDRRLRRLKRRTVASRRALAEIEDALGRLTTGSYGYCEQCGAGIPADWLLRRPEVRYCPPCSPNAVAVASIAASPAFRNLLTLLLIPKRRRIRLRWRVRRVGGRPAARQSNDARGGSGRG